MKHLSRACLNGAGGIRKTAHTGDIETCSAEPRGTQVLYVHRESVNMVNVSTFQLDVCVPFTR